MSLRPFLMYPDKRLRTTCAPVDAIDARVREIWDEMLLAMYTMPGVGLAANQLGEMRRLAVLDCSEGHDMPLRMANPEVLHASARFSDYQEASPNLPGLPAMVSRPRAVTVSYLDEGGAPVEKDFVGLWAVSVQHQIDHLNGKLFIDHLSPVKRRMLVAKHMKNMKRR